MLSYTVYALPQADIALSDMTTLGYGWLILRLWCFWATAFEVCYLAKR